MAIKIGSPVAMMKEPCLEHPDYFPPKKKVRVRDIDDPQGEDRDEMLRGFGFDPDNPNDPYSGGQ